MGSDPLRNVVHLVSGVTEMTRAKATEAAADLIRMSGLDEQLKKKRVREQVESLAGEIMAAAESNRRSLEALVRTEVDKAVALVSNAPTPDLGSAKAAVAALTAQVDELAELVRSAVPGGRTKRSTPAPAQAAPAPAAAEPEPSRVDGGTGAGSGRPSRSSFASPGAKATPSEPAAKAPAKTAAKKASPAKKTSAPATKATAPATKATTTKAPAKRAPATKATTTKAPATKASATKAPATKAPATKAAAATSSTSAPAAATATKKATAKQAPAKKATAKRSPAKKASGGSAS